MNHENLKQLFINIKQKWVLNRKIQFSSVANSSPTLQPHGQQHTRFPCLSPAPGACSNWIASIWWCHAIISSSVIPFSSYTQSFPASKSFPVSQLFASVDQSIVLEHQFQHQSFQWIFSIDFLYDWLVWSPCCPRGSQESSPAPQSDKGPFVKAMVFPVVM